MSTKRNYIDVDEDLKNPLMNLKKAIDLGEGHPIHLESGESVCIDSNTAQRMVDSLLVVSPVLRYKVLNSMVTSATMFNRIKNTLLTGGK